MQRDYSLVRRHYLQQAMMQNGVAFTKTWKGKAGCNIYRNTGYICCVTRRNILYGYALWRSLVPGRNSYCTGNFIRSIIAAFIYKMLYDCSMHSQYVCGRTVILYGTQISRHSLLM